MSGFGAVEFLLACIGAHAAGRWAHQRWVHRRLAHMNRPADEQEGR